MKKKIYLILLFAVLLTALPKGAVHATGTRCVAIDATRIYSYWPSFSAAISALEAEGYAVDVWRSGEITASRLDGYCTLIIVWPQAAYSSSEVTAILDFISGGHGLLFLGDYGENWWGFSEGVYPVGADPIIGPLGVSINNDVLYDPTNYETYTYWPKIHTFPVAHPATSGISIYMPAGGATLEVTSPATVIATGDDDTYTGVIPWIGSDDTGASPPVVSGAGGSYEPVLAASTYGAGRAVVAGDHNWIADAWSGYYDNIPLLVNVVKWLCPPTIPATIDIDPDTLNLKSNGKWITCYIELPDGYNVADIDVTSIALTVAEGEFWVDPEAPTAIGDYDSDGVPDLMVKFDRLALVEHLQTADFDDENGKFYDIPMTITGMVAGTPFEGTDTIRVRT